MIGGTQLLRKLKAAMSGRLVRLVQQTPMALLDTLTPTLFAKSRLGRFGAFVEYG